jgi:hypothetical protein
MNRKQFRDYDDMLQECVKLLEDDDDDSYDRAAIGAFYNGTETMSEEDAKRRGVTELTNHLFGYDSIQASKEQVYSVCAKSPTTWIIECDGPNETIRQKMSMVATKALNDAINCSGRYLPVHGSAAGEATLYGSAFYVFMDPSDWCPKSKRPLVPRETGILPSDVPYACIPDRLTLADLYRFREISKRQEKRGDKSYWNTKGLNDAIKYLEHNTGFGANASGQSDGRDTNEEIEAAEQQGADSPSSYRASIPVFFMISARSDEKGTPCDLTVLARHTAEYKTQRAKMRDPVDAVLFDRERKFAKPNDWLSPLFMDCSIGGEASWHRTMGLGRLNYASDVDLEGFFNDAMQGSKEQVRRLFSVANGADMDRIEKWASGEEYSNVIPEGVTVVEQGKSANFQYAFQAMQMLQQHTQRNGNMALSNTQGMQRGVKELEVQALERQGRNAMAISNKIDGVYKTQEAVGYRMLKTFLDPNIRPGDKGYPEVAYFRYLLEKGGVPIEFLRQKNDYGYINFKLKVNRVAGDGDKVREQMVNRMMMQWLPMFSPQAQQVIIRRVLASETNDHALAEELVPVDPQPDFRQQDRAQNEDQTMIQRAGSGYVAPIKPDDIHLVQIPEHIADAGAIINRGRNGIWDALSYAGFQAIGQHAMQHIQLAEAAQKGSAKQQADILQSLAREADVLERKFRQEQQQQQIDPVEQAKLRLSYMQEDRKEREFSALDEHRSNSLALSVAKEGNRSVEANRKIARDDQSAAYQNLATEQQVMQAKTDSILSGQGKGKTTSANR